MAANPGLFADAFAQARSPPAVITAVSDRLGVQRALTADLAAFLHERTLVEETYIRALERLGARLHPSSSGGAKDALFRESAALALSPRDQDRILGQSWAQLRRTFEADLAETARVHDRWRTKVETEVAQPLRDSLAKPAWNQWNAQQQQLCSSAREYDSLVDKVQKAQQKSTKSGKSSASSKLLQSQSALASLGSSMTSALPAFLSASQSLDLSHGALVKEALILCGTHTSDLGRDRMEAGERLVATVLAVDEGAEAQEWALREGMRLGGGAGAGTGGAASPGAQLAPVGEFGESAPAHLLDRDDAASTMSGATGVSRSRTTSRPSASVPPAVPLPLPTPVVDDTRSVRSSSNSHSNSNQKSGSKLGSKFSALLGGGGSGSGGGSKRDRSSSIPNSAKYANFGGGGGGAPAGTSTTPEVVPPVPTIRNGQVQSQSQQPQPPAFERQQTDTSSLVSSRNGDSGDLLGGGGRAGTGALAPPLQPEPKTDRRRSLMPGSGAGGGLFRRASRANPLQEAATPAGTREGANGATTQYGLDAASPLSAEPERAAVDAEGYSLPPEGYDRAIGTAGPGSRQATQNLLDDDDEDDAPLAASVPKLSIAPAALPPSSPVLPQEDEQARLAALESVKSALGGPPASGTAGLGRRATTQRGRRGLTDPSSTASGGSTPYASERQNSNLSSVSAATSAEDDTPLAQVVAAEKHRRAPPPPPTARATSPSTAARNSIVSSPTAITGPESPFASSVGAPLSPTGTFSPPAAMTRPSDRAMSVLSATSSLAGPSAASSSTLSSGPAARADPFATSTSPGLRAMLTESVSALLKGGEVTRALVTGEVALSHRLSDDAAQHGEEVKLRVTGLEAAEKVAPNAAFLSAAGVSPGEFTLAGSFAGTTHGATTPVLKYALSPAASSVVPPLRVKPVWRVEPGLARVIVHYAPLPSSPLLLLSAAGDAELADVRIELHLAQGRITSFQAKPNATMLPSGQGVVFYLDPAAARTEGKLLASLVIDPEAIAQPGNSSVSWTVHGKIAGNVGLELLQEGNHGPELVEVRRETVSGRYLAD